MAGEQGMNAGVEVKTSYLANVLIGRRTSLEFIKEKSCLLILPNTSDENYVLSPVVKMEY